MKVFRSVVARISLVCAVIAACIYGILMVATVFDVSRRAVNGHSLEGLVEASPLLLLAAVMLGLGYAELVGGHVRTSLVTDRIPRLAALIFRGTMGLLGGLVIAWIGWEAVAKALEAFEGSETTLGLRPVITWPAKALVPVGFGLFALQLFFRSYDDLTAARGAKVDEPAASIGGAQ